MISGARDAVTMIVGGRGTGRRSVVEACAQKIGRETIVIDVSRMPTERCACVRTARAIAREAALLDRVLVLRGIDAIATAHRAEVLGVIDREIVKRARVPIFVTATEAQRLRWAKDVVTVEMAALREAERARVWQTALPEASEETARVLAMRHPMAPGLVHAAIWRAMLPVCASVDGDVDFRSIAARFAMTGGYIKNAVLRAAFLAASEASAIAMRHFEYAAHVEYEGMGKIAPPSN